MKVSNTLNSTQLNKTNFKGVYRAKGGDIETRALYNFMTAGNSEMILVGLNKTDALLLLTDDANGADLSSHVEWKKAFNPFVLDDKSDEELKKMVKPEVLKDIEKKIKISKARRPLPETRDGERVLNSHFPSAPTLREKLLEYIRFNLRVKRQEEYAYRCIEYAKKAITIDVQELIKNLAETIAKFK